MGRMVRLTSADGHELDAYRADAARARIGGLVVVQEIFGVTDHIKRVVDGYAAAGFDAIAPAMFDRIERGVTVDYGDFETGRAYMRQLEWPDILGDVNAAIAAVANGGSVGLVGYCWGGTVAHVAAADCELAAAVSYYGAGTVNHLDKKPRCPIMYHFGDQDRSIPRAAIDKIESAYPEGRFHVYAGADHGFNCEDRPMFDAAAAELAHERSLEFLKTAGQESFRSGRAQESED